MLPELAGTVILLIENAPEHLCTALAPFDTGDHGGTNSFPEPLYRKETLGNRVHSEYPGRFTSEKIRMTLIIVLKDKNDYDDKDDGAEFVIAHDCGQPKSAVLELRCCQICQSGHGHHDGAVRRLRICAP